MLRLGYNLIPELVRGTPELARRLPRITRLPVQLRGFPSRRMVGGKSEAAPILGGPRGAGGRQGLPRRAVPYPFLSSDGRRDRDSLGGRALRDDQRTEIISHRGPPRSWETTERGACFLSLFLSSFEKIVLLKQKKVNNAVSSSANFSFAEFFKTFLVNN